MTLILGMSKPEGVYMSVDYRVTNATTGELIDDTAPKMLQVDYAPFYGGPRALLGYTGLAVLPDGTKTGDWLRETLRGEQETFDQSMSHLVERLNRDYHHLRQILIIAVLVIHEGHRYYGEVKNVALLPGGTLKLQPSFSHQVIEVNDQFWFALGSGASIVHARGHGRKIESLLGARPKHPKDFLNLLADTNRKVALSDRGVSPFSKASFVSADSTFDSQSQTFTKPDESVPFTMEHIFQGIDLTPIATRAHDLLQAARRGEELPDDEGPNQSDFNRRS